MTNKLKNMKLKEIVDKVDSFNITSESEAYKLTVFFDEIGPLISKYGELQTAEKALLLESLFQFLDRQDSELEEDWSFIHLIESVDSPSFDIYKSKLFALNKQNPSLTSMLLLSRIIDLLNDSERDEALNIFKMISDRNDISELIQEEAEDYFSTL
jgi:hypothetical protein